MKKYFIVFTLLLCKNIYCQNPEIKTDLPTIIPPSPTVAALMKFEEVPVSNYTGVPDISIPLFSSTTHSKDINLDISLKYHPSGVAADERASDVGLGWSLFAGGTISRTVRGLPDEILIYPGSGHGPVSDPIGKIGLYHTNLANNSNNYYFFKENIANVTQDYYTPNLSQQVQNIGNEFLWNAAIKGKYDTEHDLWQFNFMGKSGRFYIKKNGSNQLEVVPLEDYRIKIINHYSTDNNSYIPTSFTIYDELGNKYIFDVIETSRNFGATMETYYSYEYGYSYPDSMHSEKLFNSSFHLSKVYDNNNNLLIDFQYDPTVRVEGFTNSSYTYNEYLNTTGYQLMIDTFNSCQDFPALEVHSVSSTNINVKKLTSIDVIGIAKINFDFLQGRSDNNITNETSTSYLNSVTFKDWNNNQIKKYSFEYDYTAHTNTINVNPTTFSKRLILKKINAFGNQSLYGNNYELSYEENETYGNIIGKDSWGYFNLIDPCYATTEKHRNASPKFSTTDILQKIKYPTGGCTVFNYEANQYSYIGDQEVTNFDENPDSYSKYDDQFIGFNNSSAIHLISISTSNRKIKFYPGIHEEENPNNNTRTFSLQKKISGTWTTINNLLCPFANPSCCIDFIVEANAEYRIRRENFDLNYSGTDYLTIEYYSVNPKFYLYGGGNRIKKIGYFINDTPQNYYKVQNNSLYGLPKKEKNFSYNLFNNPQKSSGSLVFPIPLFNYITSFITNVSLGSYNSNCDTPISSIPHSFTTRTSYNNLSIVKTQGSDVGYKEVTTYETNNGKTEYTYLSPIECPEENVPTGPPFIPTKNFDYKRGLPIKEIVYDNQNRKSIESESTYTLVENSIHTATRFRKPFGECYTGNVAGLVGNYDTYLSNLDGEVNDCLVCKTHASTARYWLCGLPLDINKPKIMLFPIFEAYGWAKLTSKTTKNYFYTNISTTPNILETNETYDYNPINKKISESTITNSLDDVLKTKYYYHSGNSSFSQNRISEIEKIEKYKGTELLSTSKINYANNWSGNVSFLPQSIITSKGSNTLESKIKYNKYDEYSNPLEVQQDSGTITSYIYGYNKTQPVAKLENIAYNSIPATLITAIQTATDSATSTEAQVIAALNALRSSTDANMVKAMITTYTYIPLVGVSTITDPKGDTQTFTYDSFGRLQNVKDKNGNILSENEYHYRP
jgi:YD repeat-containing protein